MNDPHYDLARTYGTPPVDLEKPRTPVALTPIGKVLAAHPGTRPALHETDYEELPPAKNGRRPVLRESDCTNLAGQDTGRHTLSHTRLSVWLACHRKFELSYLKRLELTARPRAFTLGSAYQKAIEFGDPEVGVRFLNGFEPCEDCGGRGWLGESEDRGGGTFETMPCELCEGRGYVGEQLRFTGYEDEHLVNEAIVRAASTLYLKTWPTPLNETREFEYRVRLRSPWTGAYSDTYDLLGYADGLIDPVAHLGGGLMGGSLEVVENKLVGRVERAKVLALPLDRQLALERYGIWRATGRPVTKVYYRWVKKPSIKQREGRKKDKSDAETVEQFCQRIAEDYEARPEFYVHHEDPSFVTTKDLLRIEAELWELAHDLRGYMRHPSDGRRRAFPRDTSRCSEYGGCQFVPICTGDADALNLYHVRPPRSPKHESAPEAGQE